MTDSCEGEEEEEEEEEEKEDEAVSAQLLFLTSLCSLSSLVLNSACCYVSVLSAMLGSTADSRSCDSLRCLPCASGHYFYVPLYLAVTCSVLRAAEEYKKFVFSGRQLLVLPYSSQCLVRSGYTDCVSSGGILDDVSHVSYVNVGSCFVAPWRIVHSECFSCLICPSWLHVEICFFSRVPFVKVGLLILKCID